MPLIIKPISAMLVKDFDLIGKSDPYCIILIGAEKHRSRTCNGGGKKPSWTDTFQFNSTDNMLRVQVYDQDTFTRDDFIGQGTLPLQQYYNNPWRTENEYVDLINKGRSAGRILLSIQFQSQQPMGGGWGGNQGAWGPPNQGGWGGNQGGWGGNQGGWGGNQGGWGGNQGGWGGNQGGWGGNQGGWGGNQGGWGGNQGGWGGNQGWGPNYNNQGGWNPNQNQRPNQGGWGNQGW